MRHRGKVLRAVVLTFLVMQVSIHAHAYDGATPPSTDIAYVVDTSGSMEQTDSNHYVRDALKLGVDLAPENSRISVVTTDIEAKSRMDLTDVSTKDGRDRLKAFIDQMQNRGNTDFTVGFDRALEILQASGAAQKRIVFLGDFSEGGNNIADNDTAGIDRISAEARSGNITIDMILWGDAPETSVTAPLFLSLSQSANGELIRLTDMSRLPAHIEDIYFQNFTYQAIPLSVRGQTGQSFDIPMPTSLVRRARIYVSAQNPPSDFGASYSGAVLDGEENRSYFMIDLTNPSPEGIHLSLTPGDSGVAAVYTLLEYSPLALAVSVDSELSVAAESKTDAESVQMSTIHAEIVDKKTGTPLLAIPYADDSTYSMKITSPAGEIPITYAPDNPTSYRFSPTLPEEFGTYRITAELTVDGVTFGPFTEAVQIPDIRPLPEPPPNWPLIIALCIGAFLVLSALLVALRIRRKEVEYQGSVEMASDYRFHGKLSVYAVILDGGEKEFRPFDFGLHSIGEKRITLRQILDSVGANDAYPGAEDVLFLVGPEESLVLRNNSQAAIRIMGRSYDYRSKAQIFYDQKCHVIFGKDENELELVYRKVKEEDTAPVRYNIQSRRTSASI